MRFDPIRALLAAAMVLAATSAAAQVTQAAGYTPPDDTPAIKIGATVFADYTYQANPNALDAEKNTINPTSFNIGRAYLNVTGNLSHRYSFRVTPDIVRETGAGSSLNGSYTFRLKYAFAQMNLDDWTNKGSWLRLGLQQTPYIDYTEGIYRYRFQGPIFADREGFITSSDAGFSGRWVFPSNYGDVHAGYYNGDGYSKAEANDQKAWQVRASFRPFPMGAALKGLRFAVFVDRDAYISDGEKNRLIPNVTYESKWANAGFEYLSAKDRTASTKAAVDAKGWSAWVTPKFGHGFEALLRHDYLEPNTDVDGSKTRDIAGVAYWIPNLDKVSAAVMLDGEQVTYDAITKPDETRYAIHMLVNF